MSNRRFVSGGLALFLAVVVPALVAPPAQAQTKDASALKLACVQASDKAQQLRVAGKLLAARDTLRTCVLDACPSVVREACAQWLGEVTSSLPTIVIGAKDADGKDLLDLKVFIDGQVVTDHLGGRALPIDPGRHKMRYEKADGTHLEEEILVGEGTKNREVKVVFPGAEKVVVVGLAGPPGATQAVPGDAGSKGPSTANTVIGTVFAVVGAGALATALALDVSTTSDVNALKASKCAPNCSSSRVSSDQLDYDLAGVGLGVGIVAVGVATYIFVAHPFGNRASDAPRTGKAAGPSFTIVPTPHGSRLALTF
jgi:hypothetical protein